MNNTDLFLLNSIIYLYEENILKTLSGLLNLRKADQTELEIGKKYILFGNLVKLDPLNRTFSNYGIRLLVGYTYLGMGSFKKGETIIQLE